MKRRLAMVLACAVAAGGCDEKLRDVAGPTPDLEPTFAAIQRDIFSSTDGAGRVACVNCHNTGNARFAGNLNLTGAGAYEQLINVPSTGKTGAIRVVPGSPDASYLVQKIEGAPGIVGERMPRTNGPFLTPGQISIIRRWIQLGAQHN